MPTFHTRTHHNICQKTMEKKAKNCFDRFSIFLEIIFSIDIFSFIFLSTFKGALVWNVTIFRGYKLY